MKAEILKIAGVKNEKEFYKKFPTEEAFMKKHGKELKKAAPGISMPVNAPKLPTLQNTFASTPTPSFGSKIKTLGSNIGEGVKKGVAVPDLSTPSGLAGMIGGIGAGINTINQTDKNIAELQKYGKVSDVVLAAANTRPERIKNNEPTHESTLVQNVNPLGTGTDYLAAKNGAEIQNTYAPDVMYSDLGYEPLNDSKKTKELKKGGKLKKAISGEAISAANSLADVSRAAGQLGGTLGGQWSGTGGETGGYTQALGSFGLVGGLIGGFLDAPQIKKKQQAQAYLDKNTGLISGMGQFNNFAQQNSAVMKDGGWVSHDWQPQVIASFGEHSMKDLLAPDPIMDTLRAGGHLKYYTPPTERAMSTERAEYGTSMAMGGDLRTVWGGKAEPISYNPYLPNGGETVMFKGQSHDETNSKGQSGIGVQYGESRDGMDYAKYGSELEADVEVQRNEPATVMKDSDGQDSLLVFGGLIDPINNKKFQNVAKDISKKEAKQNKTIEKSIATLNKSNIKDSFDQLAANSAIASIKGADMVLQKLALEKEDLGHRQNAILDTAEEFKIKPENIKFAKFGGKFEATEEFGNGGKKSKAPASQYTKKGQAALKSKTLIPSSVFAPKDNVFLDQVQKEADQANKLNRYYPSGTLKPYDEQVYDTPAQNTINAKFISDVMPIEATATAANVYDKFDPYKDNPRKKDSNSNWANAFKTAYASLYPFIKPTSAKPLDPNQLNPEYLASALNQEEPVRAKFYDPILTQATSISLQDQLNEITAQAKDAMRMAQGDPIMLTRIASDAYNAKTKVLGEQFRMNQAEKQRVAEQNAAVLNDAKLKNLAISDQQMVRQSESKSKTKQQKIEIAKAIAEKYAQNKAENRKARLLENTFPAFNFTEEGVAYKNPLYLTEFGPGMGDGSGQTPYGGMTVGGKKFLPTNYDKQGKPTHYKIIGSSDATIDAEDLLSKNGKMVKAFKNF